MVNGKHGDHPYTDIIHWNDDLGMPDIAAKVRQLHAIGDPDIEALVGDLLMFIQGTLDQTYWRQVLVRHLETIGRLAGDADIRDC